MVTQPAVSTASRRTLPRWRRHLTICRLRSPTSAGRREPCPAMSPCRRWSEPSRPPRNGPRCTPGPVPPAAEAMDPRAGLRRFESRAMGSPLRLTLSVGTHDRAPAEGEGDRVWQAVVDEFEAAEEVLSRFRMTSELTGLNLMAGSGLAARPSPRLRRALAAADRAHRLTDGRFDPRVLADLDR